MKNKKLFLIIGIIVFVLFLGVGYAVVSSVYLNIGGTAGVSDSDLDVEITDVVAATNKSGKTVDFSHVLSNNNLTSTFTLNELVYREKVTITYTVTSNEKDIDVFLTSSDDGIILNNSNHNYFNVDYTIIDSTTNLENNDRVMVVLVYVELIKTPVTLENSSTTVELTLNARPLKKITSTDPITSVTPLRFGEKYYLISWFGNDNKHNDWWISFDEEGNMIQDDNKGFYFSNNEGNIYTKTSILHDSVLVYNISSDGLYLTKNDTRYGKMMFVVESLYNYIKDFPLKFSVEYICTIDNKNNDGSALDTRIRIYPNGEVDIQYSDGRFEQLPSGTVEYTASEITSSSLLDGSKFIVSSDGLTLTYMSSNQVLYVFDSVYK